MPLKLLLMLLLLVLLIPNLLLLLLILPLKLSLLRFSPVGKGDCWQYNSQQDYKF